MSRFREIQSAALHDLQGTGFSRRWLWELIDRLDLTVGSRVLVAGRRSLGLMRFLSNLGIDAGGFDDTPRPYRESENETFFAGDIAESSRVESIEPHSLDAVIAGGLRAFERPLTDPSAIRTTAGLLAAIRPGGRLAIVSGAESSLDPTRDHHAGCFEAMLRLFGAQVESSEGRNLIRWAASLWSTGNSQPADWQVCFTLPPLALDRAAWVCRAEAASPRAATPCCTAWPNDELRTVA